MKLLWSRPEATVGDLQQQLQGDKDPAYTTIATVLRRMEAQGLVNHRLEGRTFVFRAAVQEQAVTRGMADHLVDRLFEGSFINVVGHMLSTREVSRDELIQLERLIAKRKRKL